MEEYIIPNPSVPWGVQELIEKENKLYQEEKEATEKKWKDAVSRFEACWDKTLVECSLLLPEAVRPYFKLNISIMPAKFDYVELERVTYLSRCEQIGTLDIPGLTKIDIKFTSSMFSDEIIFNINGYYVYDWRTIFNEPTSNIGRALYLASHKYQEGIQEKANPAQPVED